MCRQTLGKRQRVIPMVEMNMGENRAAESPISQMNRSPQFTAVNAAPVHNDIGIDHAVARFEFYLNAARQRNARVG